MKSFLHLLVALAFVLSLTATALADAPPPAGPTVVVNGQMLIPFGHRGPHIHNNRVYVAVADFAWLTGTDFQWDAAAGALTFNGKAVTYDWPPAPHIHDNTVYAPVRVLAELVGGTVTWDGEKQVAAISFPGQTPAQKLGLPAGYTRISPTVPAMGEHWANPLQLPFGPIYLVHDGKIIGWEVMPTQADLAAGKSWENVNLLKLGPVDHVDFTFMPRGHEGLEVPHYDIHAYLISPAEKQAIR